MKHDYPRTGIATLCRLFGKTRHAYYDHIWRKEENSIRQDIVIQEVIRIRKTLPRLGTRKLHYLLEPVLATHQISIGRDYLFNLLEAHSLLVRQRRRKAFTTDSHHWMHKYSNLIKDMEITAPEQVLVSDITYIRMSDRWGYLSLITDAYSRQIMGYGFRSDLSAEGCIQALLMALGNRKYTHPLIHHSDRGSQYCSRKYVEILWENSIAISMTEKGDPYENAVAERVNGIIKNEFGLCGSRWGFEQTYHHIRQSIEAYNQMRPHSSCNYLTLQQAHASQGNLVKRWKNYKKYINPDI